MSKPLNEQQKKQKELDYTNKTSHQSTTLANFVSALFKQAKKPFEDNQPLPIPFWSPN